MSRIADGDAVVSDLNHTQQKILKKAQLARLSLKALRVFSLFRRAAQVYAQGMEKQVLNSGERLQFKPGGFPFLALEP